MHGGLENQNLVEKNQGRSKKAYRKRRTIIGGNNEVRGAGGLQLAGRQGRKQLLTVELVEG